MQSRLLSLLSDAVPRQTLDGYMLMVDTIAFSAKDYWTMWGQLGLPVIDTIDNWAQRQRQFLQLLGGES
jgi:hypothetical protein